MAKYTNHGKMSKDEQEEIFIKFAQTIARIKNPVEAAHFIRDLFSEAEALMVSRRLKIADLLDQNFTYVNIKKVLPVSDGTIARIQVWMQNYGEGFRALLARTRKSDVKNSDPITEPGSWKWVKKKYPMHFWPALLLEEVIKSANKKQRERIIKVVRDMKEKTALTNQIKHLLRKKYSGQKSNTSQY
jgi:uncharacterized protein YerC